MKKHLMVDVECLGDGSRVHVPVLQVGGAVFSFDPSKEEPIDIHEKWSVNFGLDLATQDVVSPPVCKKTMDWWQKQTDATLPMFFPVDHLQHSSAPGVPDGREFSTKGLVAYVAEWMGASAHKQYPTIWSNGVSDFQWLTGLFNRYNTVPPWAYNAPRDYRTLRNLAQAKHGGPLPPRPQIGHSHNGADDAEWQAYMLGKYLTVLGISEVP